jgi:hypothetical protein
MRSIETELPLRAEHTYTQKEKIREYERKKSVARERRNTISLSDLRAAFQLLYRMTGCTHTRTNQDNENTSVTSGAMSFAMDWISFALSMTRATLVDICLRAQKWFTLLKFYVYIQSDMASGIFLFLLLLPAGQTNVAWRCLSACSYILIMRSRDRSFSGFEF